jgi:hypothetical protein
MGSWAIAALAVAVNNIDATNVAIGTNRKPVSSEIQRRGSLHELS